MCAIPESRGKRSSAPRVPPNIKFQTNDLNYNTNMPDIPCYLSEEVFPHMKGALVKDQVLMKATSNSVIYYGFLHTTDDKRYPVVIKYSYKDKHAETLKREAMIHLNMSHENLVQVYGKCTHKGRCGLVLEHATSDLQEYIDGNRIEMTADDLVDIAIDFAKGLDFLAQRGFAHRDIKTDNMFLYMQDDSVTAKIGDLGSAIDLSGNVRCVDASTYCQRFVAPEFTTQTDFHGDTLSDVYSFGLALSALFRKTTTWGAKFEGLNEFAISGRIHEGARPDIPDHWEEEVKEFFNNLWHIDPLKRCPQVLLPAEEEIDPQPNLSFSRIAVRLEQLRDGICCSLDAMEL